MKFQLTDNNKITDDRREISTCNSSLDKALKTTEVGKKLEYNNWEEDYIRNEKEASLC